MCHMVTWFKGSNSVTTELNVMQNATFESLNAAQDEATNLILKGNTEVRVWELKATPVVKQIVEWL